MTNEELRQRYRPKQVRLLFVGESPPASGRFFYRGDSGLYRAVRDVFTAADPWVNNENFLKVFQAAGCYLTDLCAEPVDRMSPRQRQAMWRANEHSLARTIAGLHPQMIATMLRSIEGSVSNAIGEAGWSGPVLHFPYPGRWAHLRTEFIAGLLPVVEGLLRSEETL